MAKRRTEIDSGTGNVFADLGYADAKERTLKVRLALEVNRVLKVAERPARRSRREIRVSHTA
ncbi:MAG: hypothetical protein HY526_06670 [Betaproteobacteria bacterium]|nr:hypothetical protein [Betaproteobacteria bacterium]